jgi:diaminohydroxyphosphoribosylaminopyrimidine deaminase/5-amino-6-(5-phosphoribosylamino)uracil reductase
VTDARSKRDRRFVRRALRAAERGNPGRGPAAAVLIVKGETVVGTGYVAHGASARPELTALEAAGARAAGATLYATLEPSALDAILKAGIARVVVGASRKSPRSSRLQRAGVQVVRGVERSAAEQLIADWRKFEREGLPFVTLKAAVTLDGRLAARSGESKWITGELARREAHRLRSRSDAVLVGVGTVLADDPELNVRLVRGRNPLRIVLDSELRTPLTSKLVRTARRIRTLILHAPDASQTRAARLGQAGVELVAVARERRSGLNLQRALRELAKRDVVRLLVEGGARVHGALLARGLVDAAAVFIAPLILGDVRARPLADADRNVALADAWTIAEPEIRVLGRDVLVRGLVRKRSG